MALTDLTRISTSGIATGSTIDAPILRKDVSFRGSQVGVTSALFDSSDDALEFNDDVKLKFGNGGDLAIHHGGGPSGEASYIDESGTGKLYIRSNEISIKGIANNEPLASFIEDDSAELYFNGNKKFETTQTGAVVTGILTATSFSGPLIGSPINNPSGISTFYDLRVSNNLTVEGTTTTLDTNLIGVDRVEVGANSNSIVGVAITQSGTADLVRLFDGSKQVVTIDDEGKVGICTSNMTAHANADDLIVGSSTGGHAGITIRAGAGGETNIFFADSDSGLGSYQGIIQYAHTGDSFRFYTAGLPRVSIQNGGGVNLLSSQSSSSNLGWTVYGGDSTNSYSTLNTHFPTNSRMMLMAGHGTNECSFVVWNKGDANTAKGFGINNTGIFKYVHGASELVRFQPDGKVGIGTDNPSALLHVAKYTYDDPDHENFFRIKLQDQGGVMNDVGIGQVASGSLSFNNTASGRFTFHNGTNGEVFRIESGNSSGGGVGISTAGGNIAPYGNSLLIRAGSTVGTNKGHIMLTGDSATVDQGPQIVFSESGSGSSYAGGSIGFERKSDNSQGDLIFGTRGTSGDANTTTTERLRITSGGNVQVNGGAVHLDASGELAVFETDTNLAFTNSSKLAFDFSGNVARIRTSINGSATIRPLAFYTGNDERLRINTSGSVIFYGGEGGTDAISVQSEAGGQVLQIANFRGVTDTGDTTRLGVGKNNNILIFTNASGSQVDTFAIGNTDSIPLVFSTANTERLRIHADGEVDVKGGAAGQNALLVTGNYSASNNVDIQTWQRSGGAVQAKMIYKDATTDLHFGSDTAHTFSLMTGGTDRLRIHSDGKISTGVNNNSYELTIGGLSGGPTLWLRDSGTTGTSRILFGDTSAATKGAIYYSSNNNYMALYTNGTEHIRINSSGHFYPYTDATRDLGTSSFRWRNVYTTDLQLSNENTGGNEIDGTEGNWTLQEGESDIYMINRKTGKKYKMMLQEVS